MRPTYENSDSLQQEREVAELLGKKWKCRVIKLPRAYHVDYALVRDGLKGWAEIKCRNKRYDTYMLSLHKALNGLTLAEQTKAPLYLVVRIPDGIHWVQMSRTMVGDIDFGGRADRGDWQDREPVIHIEMDLFRRL